MSAAVRLAPSVPSRHTVSSGTLEALKWIGVVLMTVDHANKYLMHGANHAAFAAGRLALPIFLFVLAYNLTRPNAREAGLHARVIVRLAFFGSIATVPFVALGGLLHGWWPLNILFTLLVTTAVIYLLDGRTTWHGYLAAGLVFIIGGSLVEYWWPAIALGVALWRWCRSESALAAFAVVLCAASLAFINGNFWALASLPLIVAASRVDVRCTRARWAFYAYYPAHLAALYAVIRFGGS